jgi:ubiquinone/menaquinone biosynthesis C-methylase UbiE
MRIAAITIVLSAGMLPAQVAEKANEGYRTKEMRENVARTLSSADREARQKPKELVAALDLKPGMTVVDIGTGVGYMLPFLSDAVGPKGKVIAEDIFPDFLESAKKHVADRKNIEFVLGTEKSANLPEGVADVIFVLDAYHHFDYPQALLAEFKRAIKKDGRLIIVEFHKNSEAMANGRALEHIRLPAEDAIKEIEAEGWRLVSRRDFTPRVQWLGVFVRK